MLQTDPATGQPCYQLQLAVPAGEAFGPAEAHAMIGRLFDRPNEDLPQHVFDIAYAAPADVASGSILTLRSPVPLPAFAEAAQPVDCPAAGTRHAFRLHARACRRGINRVQRPLRLKEWPDWLARAGERYGFSVLDLAIRPTRRHIGGRHDVNISGALLTGELLVTDPAKLWTALVLGIGQGRTFGWGLLRLERPGARFPG